MTELQSIFTLLGGIRGNTIERIRLDTDGKHPTFIILGTYLIYLVCNLVQSQQE